MDLPPRERMRWSGNDVGVLPVTWLSYPQYSCLMVAADGTRILAVPPYVSDEQKPPKSKRYHLNTVRTLVRHGLIEPDGTGTHRITDRGLYAFETLPIRNTTGR